MKAWQRAAKNGREYHKRHYREPCASEGDRLWEEQKKRDAWHKEMDADFLLGKAYVLLKQFRSKFGGSLGAKVDLWLMQYEHWRVSEDEHQEHD